MSESDMKRLSVGNRVIDTEDDDPSVGVVVARPPSRVPWEAQEFAQKELS